KLDPLVHDHKPYIWSLDIGHGRIIDAFTVSGDSHYIATLSSTSLQLWATKAIQDNCPGNQSQHLTTTASTLLQPVAFATMWPGFNFDEIHHHLSLSFDGSRVAISTSNCMDSFKVCVYLFQQGSQHLRVSSSHSMVMDLYTKRAQFGDNSDIFISIEDRCIHICDAPKDQEWSNLRTIPFNGPLLDHSISGHYIALLFRDQLLIWNMAGARFISRFETTADKDSRISFGGDPSLIFLTQGGTVMSILTDTGTMLCSQHLSDLGRHGGPLRVQGQNQHAIITKELEPNHDAYGSIFRSAALIRQSKFYPFSNLSMPPKKLSPDYGPQVLVQNGSKLNLVDLEDQMVDTVCGCSLRNLSDLQDPVHSLNSGSLTMEVSIASDCRLVLTIAYDAHVSKQFEIPLPRSWATSPLQAGLLPLSSKLILTIDTLVILWTVPMGMDGSQPLHLDMISSLMSPSTDILSVKECEHGEPFVCTSPGTDDVPQQHAESSFSTELAPNISPAMSRLLQLYHATDTTTKNDIVQYLGQRINSLHCTWGPTSQMGIVTMISHGWKEQDRISYECLLKSLLESARWVPSCCSEEHNPGLVILERSKTSPWILRLFRILVDYCIDKATDERDTLFLRPITSVLHVLTDSKFPFYELAPRVMRRLAFIPAPSRSFILDHHTVAHPPKFRLKFWEDNCRPLHECSNPILKLGRSSKQWSYSGSKDVMFTKQLFVAQFDMLWEDFDATPADNEPKTATTGGSLKKWWQYNMHVKMYDYTIQNLDNPALSALIEYKWNTLGYRLWIVQFGGQCIYFAFVVTFVFMQIYNASEGIQTIFSGLLFSVAMAQVILNVRSLFLIHRSKQNISWVFAIVEGIVAALPVFVVLFSMLGDIQSSYLLYSFFTPLVMLQMFFRLRINKSICKFVTIVTRILSEIKIFFLIFVLGNVAFSTAILHMCWVVYGDPNTQFPFDFYLATTSTFFFMAGRFDPISTEFSKGYKGFHLVMVFYLFFNTIIMVNVLIAIINVGFSTADMTWHLVWQKGRLKYVAGAEHTYFSNRKKSKREKAVDDFPKEIYYTVTPAERRDYEKRWLEQEEDIGYDDPYGPAEFKDEHELKPQGLATQDLIRRVEEIEKNLTDDMVAIVTAAVAAVVSTTTHKIELDRGKSAKLEAVIGEILERKLTTLLGKIGTQMCDQNDSAN
ncbi:hypothetical protein CPC16_002884, partial [Podila verticillata]